MDLDNGRVIFGGRNAVEETAVDPVCGMDVRKQDAAAASFHHGTTYYFCSVSCKEEFDADPQRFVGAGDEDARR